MTANITVYLNENALKINNKKGIIWNVL